MFLVSASRRGSGIQVFQFVHRLSFSGHKIWILWLFSDDLIHLPENLHGAISPATDFFRLCHRLRALRTLDGVMWSPVAAIPATRRRRIYLILLKFTPLSMLLLTDSAAGEYVFVFFFSFCSHFSFSEYDWFSTVFYFISRNFFGVFSPSFCVCLCFGYYSIWISATFSGLFVLFLFWLCVVFFFAALL